MPRLSLINLWGPCPPDGYRWVDPLDGWVSHAWDYGTWVQQAINHYQVNKREIPDDLGEAMQEQLCLTLPPGWCNYDDPNRPRVSPGLGWDNVMEGLKTFALWMKQGFGFASRAEAERRALICSRCYLNVQVSGCSSCQKAVEETVGKRRTKYDFSLRACAVCKCFLRAKVHFPLDILDRENEKLQEVYPQHCWLKKDGPNYTPVQD
jgi:hypothetical protein